MSNLDLGGFDVVVHLAESVINQGLELLPSGSTFPIQERQNATLTALNVPLAPVGTKNVPLLYDAFLELERPRIDLDQATGRVTITCDLSPASQLTFLRSVTAADAALLTGVVSQIALAGSVQLDCPFVVGDFSGVWGGQAVSGRSAIARALGVAATITLVVPSADGSGNVLLATAVTGASAVQVSTAAIQTALQNAGMIGPNIGDKIGDLPLTTPVRLNSGPTPVQTVRDVFARISPPGSPSGISLGILTAIEPQSPGGNIPAAPPEIGAAGAIIWVANYWTLHLLCSALRIAHPAMTFTINEAPPSASFTGAVTVEGGDEPITIRRLDIVVNPNGGLSIDGFATASGGCWDADIDFDFNFTFTCDPTTGAVIPAASTPNVDIDVDKDLLCQIIGAIVGAIGGFIVGAIIGTLVGGLGWGTIIGGIIGAVAGGIGGFLAAGYLIDPLDLEGVSLDSISVLAGLTLPLPVGGAGMLVETCDFDDFAAAGQVVYVDLAERHRSGSVTLPVGAGFDLDGGLVRYGLAGGADDVADLLWTGTTLQTLPGATLGPVFASDSNAFGTLSLTDLEGFSYTAGSFSLNGFIFPVNAIAMARIPVNPRPDFPLEPVFDPGHGDHPGGGRPQWVSFALRTDEGRYAKCRARRNLQRELTLEYVVYARPKMCLSSLVTLETVAQTVVDSGVDVCTETRTEQTFATHPLIGLLLPTIPDVRVVARGLGNETARLVGDTFVHGNLDFLPVRPTKRPPRKACGKHTTIEHKQTPWVIVDREQRVTVQALPTGAVAPLTYRWTVFGTELPAGSGTQGIGQLVAAFDENSPILLLEADEGEDVIGSVTINATDADGRKLRATRQINSPSQTRMGGCCSKQPVKMTPIDAILQIEQGLTAQRILDARVGRLREIAATGRVQESKTIEFRRAVAELGDGRTAGSKTAAKRHRGKS